MMARLGILGLQIRLTLIRFGWCNEVALLLVAAGILAWLFAIPAGNGKVSALQEKLASAQQAQRIQRAKAAAPPAKPVAEENLARFNTTLGDPRSTEQQIKTLFAIGKKTGLILNQAEYKLTHNKSGRYYAYQIQLPLKGSYAAIRKFCEQTLLEIPCVALNDIEFKREAIANSMMEARLRFTLYLTDTQVSAQDMTAAIRKEGQ